MSRHSRVAAMMHGCGAEGLAIIRQREQQERQAQIYREIQAEKDRQDRIAADPLSVFKLPSADGKPAWLPESQGE